MIARILLYTMGRLEELDIVKTSRIDQIFAIFFKDGALVKAIHHADSINLSVKCNIAKIKPWIKNGILTEAEYYRPISPLPLISKLIEESIHNKTKKLLLLISYYLLCITNLALEQIIPQVHVFLS